MPPRMVEVSVGGRVRHVRVEAEDDDGHRLRVSVDGEERVIDVRRIGDTLSLLETGEAPRSHQLRVAAGDQAGELDVHVDRAVIRVVVDAHRSRRGDGTDAGADTGAQTVVAPMPGKVVRVLVAEGETVAKGQGVVVVEAMKMENELCASRDGRVAEVSVEAGVSVESGRVLVVIE